MENDRQLMTGALDTNIKKPSSLSLMMGAPVIQPPRSVDTISDWAEFSHPKSLR